MNWHVYVILCSDGSYYTGISTDPLRRFRQHSAGYGAKYFRGRKAVRLVYLEINHTRSTASRRELQIKQLSHDGKGILISGYGKGNHDQ